MGYRSYIAVISYTTIFILYIVSLTSSANVGKRSKEKELVPEEIQRLGQFQLHFFTVWTFILQIGFVAVAILDETSKLLNLPISIQKRLGRTRAFLFNTLVFPCSLLVVTIFWTIWHIDRELIFPKVIDTIFPLWLNHVMHTFILAPLMLELALPKKYNFVRFENAAVILIVYAVVYQLLYLSVYLRHGVWLYGVYAILSWSQRFFFTLFQLCMLLVFQKIGIVIQDRKRSNQNQSRKIA